MNTVKNKKQARQRRAAKFRARHENNAKPRLCIHRSANHIYAQIISEAGDKTLAAASSLSAKIKNGGNIEAAEKVGVLVAEQAKKIKLSKLAFDRSGFKYHGRIKALAEAARKAGLKF